ncbi:MAG: cobalamin-binding protein [Chloroflexi bacterium]|nr:MAG: cobalamin-binding protein [Chloroflexota bacterium]
MSDVTKRLYDAVLEGDLATAQTTVQEAIEAGIPVDEILSEGLVAAMDEVGCLFENGEYYVPEMLISAKTMQACLVLLKPYLSNATVKSPGKVVVGTVHGDLHDIGKNLVCMMLEGAGFEVKDLGIDVDAKKFITQIQAEKAQIVAFSAMLTTTMPYMKTIIQALNESGLRQSVKVMVGGAPLTQTFADSIGADGYAADASQAVALARQLVAA